MKPDVTIPAGYKVATKETRAKKLAKSMNGILILDVNEILEPQALVEKDVEIKKKDGSAETVTVLKMFCVSSTKSEGRLVPLSFFNPFPTERTELMGRSKFFKDVAEYPGSQNEFCDWIESLERKLKVVDNPRMNYTPYGENTTKTKVFYVLEYAD